MSVIVMACGKEVHGSVAPARRGGVKNGSCPGCDGSQVMLPASKHGHVDGIAVRAI